MSEIEDYIKAKQRFAEREKSMNEQQSKEITDGEKENALKDRWYKLGQASAFTCSAKILMDNATECFRDGNDLVANELRRLSQNLGKLGEDIHPGKQKENHNVRNDN